MWPFPSPVIGITLVETQEIRKKAQNTTLSARELEVLQWCAQGKSNGVMASILGISEKTIEFHLASIFRKLEVNGRMLAVLKGIELKLITA
jgi:LuxR family transcriptional regulator/LuxR family quorum-sensing system transcriptional regulator CciR